MNIWSGTITPSTPSVNDSPRRAIGKWVGEVYRRQPMIVPTVLELD